MGTNLIFKPTLTTIWDYLPSPYNVRIPQIRQPQIRFFGLTFRIFLMTMNKHQLHLKNSLHLNVDTGVDLL